MDMPNKREEADSGEKSAENTKIDGRLYDAWTCLTADSIIEEHRRMGDDSCTMSDESREYHYRDGFVFLERVVLEPGPDFKNLVKMLDQTYGAIHWDSEGPHVVRSIGNGLSDRNYKLFFSAKKAYAGERQLLAFEIFIRHTMPAKDYWEQKAERSQF